MTRPTNIRTPIDVSCRGVSRALRGIAAAATLAGCHLLTVSAKGATR